MIDINPSLPEQHQAPDKPLNLSDFAQQNQITEDRVWELIEEGELAARFVNDEILILREHETDAEIHEPSVDLMDEPTIRVAPRAEDHAPIAAPEPIAQKIAAAPEPEDSFSDFDDEPPFVDHKRDMLSEDNRDLLLFAQDAMTRTMELSRQLLATKDELIRFKDEKILLQQSELQKQELDIRRLKRKIEDLETLCRLNPNP